MTLGALDQGRHGRLVMRGDLAQQGGGQHAGKPQHAPRLARHGELVGRRLVDGNAGDADKARLAGGEAAHRGGVAGGGDAAIEVGEQGAGRGDDVGDIAAHRAGGILAEHDIASGIGDQRQVIAGAEADGGAPGAVHEGEIGMADGVEIGVVPGAFVADAVGQPIEEGTERQVHRGDGAIVFLAVEIARHEADRHGDDAGAGEKQQQRGQAEGEVEEAARVGAEGVRAQAFPVAARRRAGMRRWRGDFGQGLPIPRELPPALAQTT